MVSTMICLAIFSTLVVNINCLTTTELQQFSNDGSRGGIVQTTSFANYDRIQANGLPDHQMQKVNPHSAIAQNYNFTFPKEPSIACTPGCLPGGLIAITKTGVAIFNPLASSGENAVEGPSAEIFDSCQGHPNGNGRYHYHQIPDVCGLYTGATDEFIGVALDGFPIYGPKVSDHDDLLTSDDLDQCHGRFVGGKYRYHVTYEFPYFLGCFRGTYADSNLGTVSYDCGKDGTDAQEYGYICGCDNMPGMGVAPVVCNTDVPSVTEAPTTKAPTTPEPTTVKPTTPIPTTPIPTTPIPTTPIPTTRDPSHRTKKPPPVRPRQNPGSRRRNLYRHAELLLRLLRRLRNQK